ncbi:iron-containing alcohol dehydrogenase [Oceanispirochaeta crateris]|uniref:Iron-containing alcohol dehydrogenase n=1 Tax=Oceanispirochaeta crateris TaxID=2518645 RepID=A0A5C1QNJ9_9SPIO|nr:iron-containing alcohol dehydrogenase [Oceanispirochaeta crateris]QEN09533.1 iron-containing alcohol dehydrogenase [Oceanispirochaeta crateris]
MSNLEKAKNLLKAFKGDDYLFGAGVLKDVGSVASKLGKKAIIIRDNFPGSDEFVSTIRKSLTDAGVDVVKEENGAKPNCPLEDLSRITEALKESKADIIVSFGGGSTIDAAKAAEVLRTLGGEIEDYFGVGLVTKACEEKGIKLCPHMAIETVASSGAHLTKYSNITDVKSGQKKLVVDPAIVPSHPVFDYEVTYGLPLGVTMDGGLDGIAHCLEVYYSSVGTDSYDKCQEIAEAGISLVVEYLPKVIADPKDTASRDALCLATDMGGYAIMVGGTNGGHLTSFSLVDVLSHGRACAIMNPYYSVFFAPAVEKELRIVGNIFKAYGYTSVDFESLSGKELGKAAAEAMFALAKKINFPLTLGEVDGFTDGHIERALTAAKNPQLKMKLQNMPVPLNADLIDEYMGPILQAAKTGDLSLIKNL